MCAVSYGNARLKITFIGFTSTTLPAAFSVNPAGWFIHAFAAMTAAVPPMPDSTIGIPDQKCARGESRSQP